MGGVFIYIRMAGNLGQLMSSGIFIYVMYVMLLAMPDKNGAQFRDFGEQFFPFHGLSGYGQSTGMTDAGKAESFFPAYFIDFFKSFFQLAQRQTLGGIIGVIIQVSDKVIPVLPVGIGQPRFHGVNIHPFIRSVEGPRCQDGKFGRRFAIRARRCFARHPVCFNLKCASRVPL
jgi:hypothetical protein